MSCEFVTVDEPEVVWGWFWRTFADLTFVNRGSIPRGSTISGNNN